MQLLTNVRRTDDKNQHLLSVYIWQGFSEQDADFVYYDTFKDDVIKNIVNEFLENFDREELADQFNFIVKDELIEHLDKKLKYNLNIRELMNKSSIK